MHSDQLDLSLDVTRSLIVEQFPQFRSEHVTRVVSAGTDNAIFRVGASVAARFPLRAGDPIAHLRALHAEADAMREFAGCSSVATPQPVGIGKPGAGYSMPWSLQSWVPGTVADEASLSGSNAFAFDLARLIARLRAADTHGRQFSGQGRGGNLKDHDDWIATCFEKSEKLLDVVRLKQLWKRVRELPMDGSVVMSHRDLIPANLLVSGERLVGVLDAGAFGPADPALDLVAAWHLLGSDARSALRGYLGSGEIEWKRGAAWAFAQAMGLVWYYQQTNPSMSALGRSTLQRILDDPDI